MVTDRSGRSHVGGKLTRFQRVTVGLLLILASAGYTQTGDDPIDLEHPRHRSASRTDPVAQLNRRLEAGTGLLTFEERGGHLRSLLRALDIPVESQIARLSAAHREAILAIVRETTSNLPAGFYSSPTCPFRDQ
jgi:hypothetical protein